MLVSDVSIQYFGNNTNFDDAKVVATLEDGRDITLSHKDRVLLRFVFEHISLYIGAKFFKDRGIYHQNQILFIEKDTKKIVGTHYYMTDFLSKFKSIDQIGNWFCGIGMVSCYDKAEKAMKELIKYCFEKNINPVDMILPTMEYDLHFPIKMSKGPTQTIEYKEAS